jgi:hypothetical protein
MNKTTKNLLVLQCGCITGIVKYLENDKRRKNKETTRAFLS